MLQVPALGDHGDLVERPRNQRVNRAEQGRLTALVCLFPSLFSACSKDKHDVDNLQEPNHLAGVQVARAARKATAQRERLGLDNGPPARRLLNKNEVLSITGVTFMTVWSWMRAGKFPKSRVVGGRTRWVSTDIDAWLEGLPVRKYKGDAE